MPDAAFVQSAFEEATQRIERTHRLLQFATYPHVADVMKRRDAPDFNAIPRLPDAGIQSADGILYRLQECRQIALAHKGRTECRAVKSTTDETQRSSIVQFREVIDEGSKPNAIIGKYHAFGETAEQEFCMEA